MIELKKIEPKLSKLKKLIKIKGLLNAGILLFNTITRKNRKKALEHTKKIREKIFSSYDINELNMELYNSISNGLLRDISNFKEDIKLISKKEIETIIDRAENIIRNEYQIYGHLKIDYKSNNFSWLVDPVTSYTWTFKKRSYYVNDSNFKGTDIKTVWEIARFQFLSIISIAYIYTGNEKYAKFGVNTIKSWINQNEFLKGPHWMIAMEASIRLLNWCLFLPVLDFYLYSSQRDINNFTTSVIEHLIFIKENLEYSLFKKNNHYFANIVGLLAAKILFPTKEFAKKYTDFAFEEFYKQIMRQFDSSGINFEGSLSYHRLSTEMCIVGIELTKRMDVQLPDYVKKRILNIAKFTEVYTKLGEKIPVIGDNDSGVFIDFMPGKPLNDHKYLNTIFRMVLSENKKLNTCSNFLPTIFFKKNKMSKDINHNNIWTKDFSKSIYVANYNGLIIGFKDQEGLFFNTFKMSHGHTHNDKLSIYPIIRNKHIFVDRGTFCYTGFTKKRLYDRQTSSHNCPVINQWEQNKIWENDVFYINEDANTNNKYNCNNKKLRITGWHDGYKRFRTQMKVFRQIDWDFEKKKVTISDWIENSNNIENYLATWNYLINPYWKIRSDGNSIYLVNNNKEVVFTIDNHIEINIEESTYCPNYMQELNCMMIKCKASIQSKKRLYFYLNY